MFNWEKANRPLIVDKETANKENYLFYDQICEFNKIIISDKSDKPCDKKHYGKVVSVIGERGTGKTSFLETISNCIEDTYWVIGLIDPNSFDSSLNLMEVIFSTIYHEVTEDYKKHALVEEKIYYDLITHIKKASGILNSIRLEQNDFIESNLNEEILDNYAQRIQFKEIVGQIMEAYIWYKNKSKNCCKMKIAVIVDDLDMTTSKRIYKMLEDIRMYLQPYVLVILSYRADQLKFALYDYLVKENKELIDKKIIDLGEIESQSSNYINKTLPPSGNIYLPSGEKANEMSIVNMVSALDDNNDQKYIQKQLFEDFGIIEKNIKNITS